MTITDTIPQHTAYVHGSVDNGGVFADGKLTWTLNLAAGESKTVTFKVNVVGEGVTVVNTAVALEGGNELTSNQVKTTVDAPPVTPDTGDDFNIGLIIMLLFLSGSALVTLIVVDKKKKTTGR